MSTVAPRASYLKMWDQVFEDSSDDNSQVCVLVLHVIFSFMLQEQEGGQTNPPSP